MLRGDVLNARDVPAGPSWHHHDEVGTNGVPRKSRVSPNICQCGTCEAFALCQADWRGVGVVLGARLHLAGGQNAPALGHDVNLSACTPPPRGKNPPPPPHKPALCRTLARTAQYVIAVVVHAPMLGHHDARGAYRMRRISCHFAPITVQPGRASATLQESGSVRKFPRRPYALRAPAAHLCVQCP